MATAKIQSLNKLEVYSSRKKRITPISRKVLSFFTLLILLFCFHENSFGQATPGGVPYTIEFWLRADYTHVPAERVGEGEDLPVWITVAGISRTGDSGQPSQNHWGRCPVNGNASNGYYSVPKLSYDGMNFLEAVEFEGSATQKLAGMFPVAYTNSESYYFFFVSELNTAKTSGSYAALLSFCNNSNGNGNNGIGWSGSGTGLWWNNGTSATARTQATIGKSYGITSYIRTNSSSLPMVVYHNGKKYETGAGQLTGTMSGQYVFMANNGLSGSPFYGKIQEIIMLKNTGNQMIDKKELDKIHSYLAIKYGQTLDNVDQPNLYAANGAEIWNGSTNSGYTSGMFGLACDKTTNFFLKQGQSADDERLTAFLGNSLERRNADNQNTLYAEGQNRLDSLTSYLIFGHNGLIDGNTGYSFAKKDYVNGITLTDEDINLRSRLIYRAQATYCPQGSTTPNTASYTVSFQTGFAAQYMMVSSAPDFNPDYTRLYPLTNNTATNVLVNNGEYITFLVNEPGPGGVPVRMWLKADDISNLVINSANNEVNSWRNSAEEVITYSYTQSTIDTSPTVTNSRPKYKASDAGMNYHPTLDFNPATCATKYPFLSSSNAVFSTNVPTYYTIITAANVRQFGAATGTSNDEITYFMGFGATSPGSSDTGDPNSRRPAMGIAKNSAGKGVARFWSYQSLDGTTGLFNPGATSITLFEVGTASTDRYLQFESDGYSERIAGTTYLGNTSYSQLAGSSMLGIGSRKQRQLDGTMSEVIAFEGKLDADQKQQIYSYLGLKYGITLDLDKNSTATNYNYLLSGGIVVWPGTSNALHRGYHNNVAGLVRDNTSALNNKQARSTDTGAIVRIGIGNSLGEDGVLTGLNKNMESLMWGHNAGTGTTILSTTSSENCGGLESRMNRVWLLDNTRTQENYTLLISAGGDQAASVFPYNSASYQVYMIIAKTAANVTGSPANWTLIPGIYKDGEHYFNYTLPANTDYLYFTFGAIALPGACESCEYEGTKTLEFTKTLWPNGTTTKKFTALTEIAPTVSTAIGSGATFYSQNPRSYAGKTLRITRQGTSSATMTTTVALDKAATASFSIYEIDRRSSLYDKVTVYGLCDGNRINPRLYYGGNASTSSYSISGNVATANSKTSSALSSVGKMNVEFTERVQSIVIEHVVTGAASGWKRIGLSPIEFSCPISTYDINADGLAFRKGAPSEVSLCEDVQFVYKIYNADCQEKPVTFTDVLPMGMCWIENSLSVGEYNESQSGFNVTYDNNLSTGASTLTIDKLYVPGGGEFTFFATARFVSEVEAEAFGHSAPEAGEYSGTTTISYSGASGTVELESCDIRSSIGCVPTIINASGSAALKPITASITTDKNTYSENQVIEVTINLENENKSAVSGSSFYAGFNDEFTYVTGSFTFNNTSYTPTSDMSGSFNVNGLSLAAESSGVIKFKLTAPAKTGLASNGAGGYLPLGIEYSMESAADDVCSASVLSEATGSLDIPYQEVVNVPVTGVTLDEETITIDKGKTGTLTATVAPENATNKNVSWTTSDPLVATVDENGVVTAVGMNPDTKSYTATITVTTEDGKKTATCVVTVNIPVEGVSVEPKTLSLMVGKTEQLTATIDPSDATNKGVKWESSDPSIATVDDTGKVTAIKEGTTNIVVTTLDGGKFSICEVTVTKLIIPVTDITLKGSTTIVAGSNETLVPDVTPSNTTSTLTWTSSDPSVASVDNDGKVTAIKEGTTTITVSADGESATCTVLVTPLIIPVTGLTLKDATTIVAGNNETLIPTVTPSNTTSTLTWTSSNPSVASVDNDGKVTAIKEGTTTITVSADGKSATCAVTVTPLTIPVTGLALKDATTIIAGNNETLIATVTPSNTTSTLTWTSNNKEVADVDQDGKVTAIAEGTATITVSADGKSATCTVTVIPILIPATKVELNKESTSIEKGSNETLIATVTPSNTTTSLTWHSNDPSIATVDQTGKITAVAAGTTTITASADGKSASCEVTVIISVTGVSILPTTLNLNKGETGYLEASILPTDATNKDVTWSSSNESVVTVDATGKVTAVGGGDATITVKTEDGGKTATCAVTVTVPVTGVDIALETLSLTVGATSNPLSYTITPSDASNKNVSWSSSDESVATVDQSGVVTAHTAGETTITITTADGSETDDCVVTVETADVPVTGVEVFPKTAEIEKGKTRQLTATVLPVDATNKNVTWSSSDESVAMVDADGLVTAHAAGNARITATTAQGGYKDFCDVTVTVPVTGVTLTPSSHSMVINSEYQLEASVQPSDAVNRNITWTSSNEAVATVDANGKVTAKAAGTSTITVRTQEGNFTATCEITVTVPVTGVTLKESTTLLAGGEEVLTPTILPDNATNKNVSWASDNDAVATVDANGKVTAIAVGTAIITVTTADGGKTATCEVTVSAQEVDVEEITLSLSDLAITVGNTTTLTATIKPGNATNQTVTWSSSDPSVATVDPDTGLITAVTPGIVTITATANDNSGVTATCEVTVNPTTTTTRSAVISNKHTTGKIKK